MSLCSCTQLRRSSVCPSYSRCVAAVSYPVSMHHSTPDTTKQLIVSWRMKSRRQLLASEQWLDKITNTLYIIQFFGIVNLQSQYYISKYQVYKFNIGAGVYINNRAISLALKFLWGSAIFSYPSLNLALLQSFITFGFVPVNSFFISRPHQTTFHVRQGNFFIF